MMIQKIKVNITTCSRNKTKMMAYMSKSYITNKDQYIQKQNYYTKQVYGHIRETHVKHIVKELKDNNNNNNNNNNNTITQRH